MRFRVWVQHKWFEHINEIENWNKMLPKYSQTEYIKKNKWWLKQQYKLYRLTIQSKSVTM